LQHFGGGAMLEEQPLFSGQPSVMSEVFMVGSRITGLFSTCIRALTALCMLALVVWAPASGQDTAQQTGTTGSKNGKVQNFSRGKKLVLKDGTYQLAREYQRNGDRVRYFSVERGEWEEIPAALIDWDATAKDEAMSQQASGELVEKIHKQEEAKRMDNVMDIDASLQVGNGAFLPSGEGLFVVEGKSVRLLTQADTQIKNDMKRLIERSVSPIPIVPGKQNVTLAGTRATLRLRTGTPEFYLREAPPDPDRTSPVRKSSRPGEDGPDVILIHAKVTRKDRQIESISKLFGQEMGTNRNEVALQRWEVAPSVYRFTLGEQLTPGEYVVAEVLPDGLNYYVWDFGLDGEADAKKK
jgi:hypothetical protein